MIKITLEVSDPPERVDAILLRHLRAQTPKFPRAQLKEWFSEKKVLLRGKPLRASQELRSGEYEITVDSEPLDVQRARPSLKGSFVPVLYEDDSILILNKPSGIPTLPHQPDETETAVGSALAHFPGLAEVGRAGFEPGLLHRLDTGTSGALVFAKNDSEFDRLSVLWREGKVRKIYRALSCGNAEIPKVPITLRYTLGHDADSARRMIAMEQHPQAKIRGKTLPTVTHLKSAAIRATGANSTIDFEIEIHTGVMHQIRCSLAALGWPVLGDRIYRGASSERLWLHAWRLLIPMRNDTSLTVEATLPTGWGPP